MGHRVQNEGFSPILHTTDGGTTWQTQASGTTSVLAGVAFVDVSNGWAVGWEGTIVHTTDGGNTWESQNSGTANRLWGVAFADANNGWAVGEYGTILHYNGGLWSPASRTQTPEVYSLGQNYPNPFNPATTIHYTMKTAGKVSVKVYDVLGQEVATLVEGVDLAGEHAVIWNAAHVPSGVYFCRMEAGSFAQTRKVMLLK